MSDFCFGVSERIARETDFPRTEIIEVDRFLAATHRREFKLHDIEDFTNVSENAEGILNEYIARHTVARETRYFCPNHKNTALELPKKHIPSADRYCPKCEKSYSINGLGTETIFIKKNAAGRRVRSHASPDPQPTDSTPPMWWRVTRWIVEKLAVPIILVIAGIIIRDALSSPHAPSQQLLIPTATLQAEISATPTNSATPAFTITPTNLAITLTRPTS